MIGSRKSQPPAAIDPARNNKARPTMNTFEARFGFFKGRDLIAGAADGDTLTPDIPFDVSRYWIGEASGAEGMPRPIREPLPVPSSPDPPIVGRVGAPGMRALCPCILPPRAGNCIGSETGCCKPLPQAAWTGAGAAPVREPVMGICPAGRDGGKNPPGIPGDDIGAAI